MFADSGMNLRYVYRALGKVLRSYDIEKLGTGNLVVRQYVEELILYASLPDWRERDCEVDDLPLSLLIVLAQRMDLGLRLEFGDSEALDEWIVGVDQELAVASVTRRNSCIVCRHPNQIEIELAMSAGMGTPAVSRAFRISTPTLTKHRTVCMGQRLERLQAALGTTRDLMVTEGTVKRVDAVMELGHRAAEMALTGGAASAAGDVNVFMTTLLQAAEIRGKLTGELGCESNGPGDGATESGSVSRPGHQVSVFVVPGRDANGRDLRQIVDVRGEPG